MWELHADDQDDPHEADDDRHAVQVALTTLDPDRPRLHTAAEGEDNPPPLPRCSSTNTTSSTLVMAIPISSEFHGGQVLYSQLSPVPRADAREDRWRLCATGKCTRRQARVTAAVPCGDRGQRGELSAFERGTADERAVDVGLRDGSPMFLAFTEPP